MLPSMDGSCRPEAVGLRRHNVLEIRVGCAGWSLPAAAAFRGPGSQLERYARMLGAVEINTTFYRPRRRETYERWAGSVPPGFRFSVKVPRAITHVRRLVGADDILEAFLEASAGLGERRGPLLVQLPPTLGLDPGVAEAFFSGLRHRFDGTLACEPRHASWFTVEAEALLQNLGVARVAADPPRGAGGDAPGGVSRLAYIRLHGSPRVYYSAYSSAFLESLAARVRALAERAEVWVIFDNTASGAAVDNALELRERLQGPRGGMA